VRKRFEQSNLEKTDDLIQQMEQILGNYRVNRVSDPEKLVEAAPEKISNIMEL